MDKKTFVIFFRFTTVDKNWRDIMKVKHFLSRFKILLLLKHLNNMMAFLE